MVGGIKYFATLLENSLRRNVFWLQIIHRQALCGKDFKLSCVVNAVECCINNMRTRSLNRRRFRQLFPKETGKDGELILRCSVRWLSKVIAFARFWNLWIVFRISRKKRWIVDCGVLITQEWILIMELSFTQQYYIFKLLKFAITAEKLYFSCPSYPYIRLFINTA